MIGKNILLSALLAACAGIAVAKGAVKSSTTKTEVSTKTRTSTTRTTEPSRTSDGTQTQTPSSDDKRGYINAVYYPSWYDDSVLDVGDLPVDDITHIIYAFTDLKNGTVAPGNPFDLHDKWVNSNTTKHKNAEGNVEDLFNLKSNNRHIKVLLSIGGWNISQTNAFNEAANSRDTATRFAESAVKLMVNWGMDGLDIDWESLSQNENDFLSEANQLKVLVQACRKALDKTSREKGDKYRYTLSIALQADPSRYSTINLGDMDKSLDYWFLMGFDYSGTFSKTTAHLANLKKSKFNQASTPFNTEDAFKNFTKNGIPANKMVLGMPLYGAAFGNPTGLFGKPYHKNVTEVGYDKGKWHYKNIPCLKDSSYDAMVVGAWCMDEKNTLYSYDNKDSVKAKAGWIKENKLAGAMFWEASGDKKENKENGDVSLVRTVSQELKSLDLTENQIEYPESRFDNIKDSKPKDEEEPGKKGSGKKVRAALQKGFKI